MSDSLISKGRNLKEAINIGLDLMQVTKEEVDIEIIEQESKRLFGILNSKPAVVRLVKKNVMIEQVIESSFLLETEGLANNPNMDQREMEPNHGVAWVKDGRLYCKENGAHSPTITPVEGVSLYKNGVLIKETTVLSEKDQIKIEFENDWKETTWFIDLDSTKMAATLKVEPGYKKSCSLIDQEPSPHLLLETAFREEIINNLQLDQIHLQMKELGITTGIQKVEMMKAAQTKEKSTFTIAKGVSPQRGEDGWLEVIVDTELKHNGPKILENGNVDYREIKSIPNVEKGQVIGIIHSSKPGKAGWSVTGGIIQPEASKELIVQIHQGANLIEGGTKIVALESGRPNIEKRGNTVKVSIMPKIVQPSDVNLSSGNLHYIGDIEVQGNIEQGMLVDAAGDVLIQGSVDRSTIVAGNQIILCGNLINSHLKAGEGNLLVTEITQLLEKISVELNVFFVAIDQIYLSPDFKISNIDKMGLSSLIRMLLSEKKFHSLPTLIKKMEEIISEAKKQPILDDEYNKLTSDLVNGFLKVLPGQFQQPKDIVILRERVKQLYESSIIPPESNSSVVLPYALNSEIYCSGDISIVEQGCMNTKIYSGGKVLIRGVMRGGEVFSKMGIEIGEAGTRGGTLTRIQVPKEQTIKINSVMEGTVIQIGNKSYEFLSSTQNVFARVNTDGHLLLY
jgi:uncharacterized protein